MTSCFTFSDFSFQTSYFGGGWVLRCCWVNFQCRGVLLIWPKVGQGPTALAVGADGGCLDIFTPIYLFSPLSPSLWETARYRLKYCLKGPLKPKQPTKHYISQYSRTSMARTLMARLPRLFRQTRSWVPREKSHTCRFGIN